MLIGSLVGVAGAFILSRLMKVGRPIPQFPVELLPIVRKRGNSPEIVHDEQTWLPVDEIILLAKMSAPEATAILEKARW